MKKILSLLLVMMLLAPAMGVAEMTENELHAWALANGYVKTDVDALTSATTNKAGGVNFGAIEWTEELQVMAIKEFLKGGHYLGDASYAQDESGWNYREMYQMATVFNNVPNNTNLELVLDIDTLCLLGVSEAGTSKTLHFNYNPNVSISWCRQLRPYEEETYNYYCSYGVQFDGVVRIFTPADLETEEGKAKLLNLFDKYYPTLATSWMGYAATFANLTNADEITAAKLGYIEKQLKGGAMVIYEVVPTRIIITAPFLINMSPSMTNGIKFVNAQEGEKKYAYDLLLTEEFLDALVAYKNDYLATEEGLAQVQEYYATGMYPMLDGLCAQYGAPTSLQIAMMPTTAAGLKTQTTWEPAPVAADENAKIGTANGFHGTITAEVTLNEDGTIATLKVDTSCEHADYGAKVGTDEAFLAQFIGETGPFTLGEGIDAVTGATGSSKSAVEAINNAVK
ncbi:MAG: FMN-binding protein [Clostridiales bacterium]|nr:FMN-binding protein [Clostridiales bacterium]